MTDTSGTPSPPTRLERASYVLKWHNGSDHHRCDWFIRGIHSDRSFYGEITVFSGVSGRQVNVAGRLSESDYARFVQLASEIEERRWAEESVAPWEGLLAIGPVHDPRILFKYRQGDEESGEAASRFLKLIEILAPYLSHSCGSLD